MINNYILILISVLLAAVGQIILKKAVVSGFVFWQLFTNYLILGGLFCYAVAAFLWIKALSEMNLNRVYPFTFLTYVLVMGGSYFLLGEKTNITNLVIGSTLIVLGIAILNFNR